MPEAPGAKTPYKEALLTEILGKVHWQGMGSLESLCKCIPGCAFDLDKEELTSYPVSRDDLRLETQSYDSLSHEASIQETLGFSTKTTPCRGKTARYCR